MTKTHCDHCNNVFVNNRGGYKELSISIGKYSATADLCCCCLGQLISIVENFIDMADFELEGSAKNETD